MTTVFDILQGAEHLIDDLNRMVVEFVGYNKPFQGTRVAETKCQGTITNIYTTGDKIFVVLPNNRTVHIWDIVNNETEVIPEITKYFTNADDSIISGTEDHKIIITNKGDVKTYEGHTDHINIVVTYKYNNISGSNDHTIRVWDGDSCKILNHTSGIWCIAVSDGRIVSGLMNGHVYIWDMESWDCTVLHAHTAIVWDVIIVENKVVSCSEDATISIYDIITTEVKVMNHSEPVFHMKLLHSRHIISGSQDCSLKVWDLHGNCLATMNGHDGSITSIAEIPYGIVSSALDGTIRVWDEETGTCHNVIQCKSTVWDIRTLPGGRIIGSPENSTVVIWE